MEHVYADMAFVCSSTQRHPSSASACMETWDAQGLTPISLAPPITTTSETPLQASITHLRGYWAAKKRDQRRMEKSMVRMKEADEIDEGGRKRICRAVAKYWRKQTQGFSPTVQMEILRQLLEHPTFLGLQGPSRKVEGAIFSSICNTLSEVKIPRSSNELFLKRATVMACLNSSSAVDTKLLTGRKVANALGVHRRNIIGANLRLHCDDDTELLPLSACQRQSSRSSEITHDIKDLVFEFWAIETRVSPNKKDICRKRIGRKAWVTHPLHLLDMPQVDFYKRFMEKHSEVKISLRCFESLKPYFVRKLKDRNSCCCEYHVQMLYLKDAFNQMRQGRFGHHGRSCKCNCTICLAEQHGSTCNAADSTFQSLTTLWESLLCSKPVDSAFHSKKCLIGMCDHCGTSKLALCPCEELEESFLVTVKIFADVETNEVDEEGNTRKRKDLVCRQLGGGGFVSLFRQKLSIFVKHNYIYRWQAEQFKQCLQNFPDDVVVSVIDFAENYSFKVQNEIQSMHWYSNQVTILVHISYIRSALGQISKTTHFYISDDRVHDTLFVQHCLLLHNQWLKDQGYNLKRHCVWSDGAASQFKARRPFYFVARYFSLTGVEMMHNYFGSGHGKGEHDGAGAVVKRALTSEQLKVDGCPLFNAKTVVDFLNAIKRKERLISDKRVDRVFWEIKLGAVDRDTQWDCKRISGSRSLHCVNGYSSTDRYALRCRDLSCFCDACMQGHWRRCRNKGHVENWQYLSIQTADNAEHNDVGSSDDESAAAPLYAGHHDDLSDALMVGDNFAVNAEEESEDFYILKCSAAKRLTTTTERDSWSKMTIKKNSYVVEGHYYDKVQGAGDLYILLDDSPPAILYSHFVRCLRFPMDSVEAESKVHQLGADVFDHIYNSMPYFETM